MVRRHQTEHEAAVTENFYVDSLVLVIALIRSIIYSWPDGRSLPRWSRGKQQIAARRRRHLLLVIRHFRAVDLLALRADSGNMFPFLLLLIPMSVLGGTV
jgi:hypothetical protein